MKNDESNHIIRNLTVNGRPALLACKRSACTVGRPGFATVNNFTPDYFGVNYVIAGRGVYTDGKGNTFALKPGSLFQRFPTGPHSTSMAAEGYDEFCLTFDVRTFRHLREIGVVQDSPPVFQIKPSRAVIQEFENYRNVLRDDEASVSELMIRAQQLLNSLYKWIRPEEAALEATIREARAQLSSRLDQRISVSEIARELGMGYHTFRRVFREQSGSSPADYRIRRRIDRACELLASCNVQETARQLGYPDPFTFSEQFKRFTGMPPRQYRDMLRQP